MQIGSLFAEASLSVRGFLWLRSHLTPYQRIASELPKHGRILDLGAGHGLLSFALSLGSNQRGIVGVDHDAERVRIASAAASRLPVAMKPRFEVGDLKEKVISFSSGSFNGVAMIDILHYFDPPSQEILITEAARVLAPGGVLAVREIDAEAGIKAAVNRLYERVATGVGFTRSANRKLNFRGARAWIRLLEDAGLKVRLESGGSALFADVLLLGRKG